MVGRQIQFRANQTSCSGDEVRCRFMGSLHSLLRMHWEHEPDWHPSPCPLPARRGEGGRRPGEGWFMESLHSLLRTHWDHEPLRLTEARSGPRVCDPQLARFMESFHDLTIAHLNHELARTILCCTCNKQLSRWRRGSWKGERFLSRNAHGPSDSSKARSK